MVAEAMDAGWKVRACLVEEGKEELLEEIPGIREGSFPVYRLPVPLFRSLMDTETPRGLRRNWRFPRLGTKKRLRSGRR